MKLLVLTQKISKNDPTLGFFVRWLAKFSPSFEKISVICLEKKDFDLPKNISIYSLGKESGTSKIKYIYNFYRYLWDLRGKYDAVFVHMNEEYVLLGGLFWKLSGKKVFLWRNHPKGSFWTRIAVSFCKKVFCTSKDSFTAKFKKTVLMPVGVDTEMFREDKNISRNKNSVCMVGRIAPIKKIEVCLQAISILIGRGVQISLSVLGPCAEKDLQYLGMLKSFVLENNLSPYVKFFDAVSPADLPNIYNSHEILVNLTETGSFDKTIVEAVSCGEVPLVSNQSLKILLPGGCVINRKSDDIASAIQKMCQPQNRINIQEKLGEFVKTQSLDALMKALDKEMTADIKNK